MATVTLRAGINDGRPLSYYVDLPSGKLVEVHCRPDGAAWLVCWRGGGTTIWQSRGGTRPLPGPASITGKAVAAVEAHRKAEG